MRLGRTVRQGWSIAAVAVAFSLGFGLSSFPTQAEDKGGSPGQLALDLGDGVKLDLVLIPSGTFTMGDEGSRPAHPVTLTRPFYLGGCEITQEQYEKAVGSNPSMHQGAKNPVEMVTWNDAVAFCQKVSEKTGKAVRLPTEAEWEYACRAGTTTTFSFGDDDGVFAEHGWINDNSGKTPRPAGEKKANAWGLHDMHGNVHEWCGDWFGEYAEDAATDPAGPPSGEQRVMRGGSWGDNAWICRSAARHSRTPDYKIGYIGFRVVVETGTR